MLDQHLDKSGAKRSRECAAPPVARPDALLNRMKWAAVAVALLTVAAASTADAAGEGRVIIQKGIDGVRLGMTPAQVRSVAGTPRSVERGASEVGRYTAYRYRTFVVTFFGGRRVTQMHTVSPAARTSAGIGVGSTRAAVATRVPRAQCAAEAGFAHCWVGQWRAGGTVTDFVLRNGRVARVTIGYVID